MKRIFNFATSMPYNVKRELDFVSSCILLFRSTKQRLGTLMAVSFCNLLCHVYQVTKVFRLPVCTHVYQQ